MGGARFSRCVFRLLTISCAALSGSVGRAQVSVDAEWPNYGNDPGGMRYSALSQINRDNVSQLKVAWTFHTGDVSDGSQDRKRSGFEATPILVDGTLYLTTPFNRVIALDPEKGTQRWAYDPKIDVTLDYGDGLVNRGVATWLDPTRAYRASVPPPNLRSYPGCPAGFAGRRNRQTVPGFRRLRPGKSAGCPRLSRGLVPHDLAACGDRRSCRSGIRD